MMVSKKNCCHSLVYHDYFDLYILRSFIICKILLTFFAIYKMHNKIN